VTALGNRAHLFAHPRHRDALVHIFGTVLGCVTRTVPLPNTAEPMLALRFPDGGALSIEFRPDALDTEAPSRGAWLEIRTRDLATLRQAVREAGLSEVHHPGHEFYFSIPGGQVFAVVPE
jgi:hypothetical protein